MGIEVFMREGQMTRDEIYTEYLTWCVANKLPPLNPLQYEKVVASISSVPDKRQDTRREKDK